MFLLLDARAFEIKFYLTVILIKELKREGERKRERQEQDIVVTLSREGNSKGSKYELFRREVNTGLKCSAKQLSLLCEMKFKRDESPCRTNKLYLGKLKIAKLKRKWTVTVRWREIQIEKGWNMNCFARKSKYGIKMLREYSYRYVGKRWNSKKLRDESSSRNFVFRKIKNCKDEEKENCYIVEIRKDWTVILRLTKFKRVEEWIVLWRKWLNFVFIKKYLKSWGAIVVTIYREKKFKREIEKWESK